MKVCILGASLALLVAIAVAEEPPSCKPVEHYGVKGCQLLPGQTCPPGYHKEAVGPPNPKMMGPTHLMCVPDKPPAKPEPPKPQPKPDR